MMDVLSARWAEEELVSRIDRCEQRIRQHLENQNSTDLTAILGQLDSFDREVLEGDWGGYYESYRRPLIRRLDGLRDLLGQAPPERAEEVWNRPAPRNRYISPQRNSNLGMFGRAQSARPAVSNSGPSPANAVVVLTSTGTFSSDKCSICLDGFSDNSEQGYAACGHRFHAPCIRLWVRQKGGVNVPCPLCHHNILEENGPKTSAPRNVAGVKAKTEQPKELKEENRLLQKEITELQKKQQESLLENRRLSALVTQLRSDLAVQSSENGMLSAAVVPLQMEKQQHIQTDKLLARLNRLEGENTTLQKQLAQHREQETLQLSSQTQRIDSQGMIMELRCLRQKLHALEEENRLLRQPEQVPASALGCFPIKGFASKSFRL